ncbi:MAG: SDR family NAD(P)-dependent oxidoreductase, partial [Proteobacteria bacterium]|nr:SDR family NAD(P)-dependent oxidoreductase [Pseudomonadota bacterium]
MTEVLRFATRLQAEDFVVSDHRVHGVRIMPGVAFLDMVWRLLDAKGYDPTRVEIRDVLFSEAVALAEGETRRIVIEATASADVWEVVARSRIEDRSEAVWSENFRCRIHFGWAGDEAAGSTPFDGKVAAVLAMDEVYGRARAVEIAHAARMRMTGEIRKSASAAEASLTLTPEAAEYEADYIVHPAVLDTATLVPFVFRDPARITKPYIPLSIERVTLAGPVEGHVLVRVIHDPANDEGGDLLFHDYTLCDSSGRALVKVERLCAKQIRNAAGLTPPAKRALPGKAKRPAMPVSPAPVGDGAPIPSQAAVETFLSSYFASVTGQTVGAENLETGFYDLGLDSTDLLEAVRFLERGLGSELYPTLLFERSTVRSLAGYLWEEHRAGVKGLLASGGAVSEPATVTLATRSPVETLYLRPVWREAALGPDAAAPGALVARGRGSDAVAASWPGTRTDTPDEATAALFAWSGEVDVTDLLTLAGALPREATLIAAHEGGAEGQGVAGLLASVARERPGLRLAALEGASPERMIAELRRAASGFRAVRYRDGLREEAGFAETSAAAHALPEGGVWAITGGLGGLGLTFARALVARGAKVGLIGRSAPDPDLAKGLEAEGIAFTRGDVTNRDSLKTALDSLRARLGLLTGVIHAAGVLRDGLAGRTSEAEVQEVLAPKITGARHLDELTRDDPLDWFVLFGSATGSLGNAGQGAYGYANGWLAGFAAERSGPGRSLTLGWPLWDRGMASDSAEDAESLRARHGLVPLDTESGLTAFGAALGQDAPHLVVLHGEAERLRSALEVEPPRAAKTAASYPEPVKPSVTPAAGAIEPDAVAVIGLAGRYPGAADLRAFWRNLAEGVDGVSEVPPERWDHRAYFDAEGEVPGTSWSRWGGFLEGIDLFDPLFFGISPREAKVMDPQERLFLETAWAALEDGALSRDSVKGRKVGVYAGVMWSQYQLYGLAAAQAGNWLQPMSFNSSVANRLSHVLDLHGPSLSLDTACSSSLTALHLAIESLRRGECELAFAGGVNLTLHPSKYQFLGQGRMLSRDGKCRAFGDGGDGYVPGEGVGVALLKPLQKAIEDGDPIRGVILGSGVSHGGKTAGYTVPSAERQADLIQSVLAEARVRPEEVSYVEAHGTGTALGDPIEVEGLKAAFGKTASEPWCALGSVKSNIGHLESAAGIAGLTKLLLQLEARELAPSLHAEPQNRHLAIHGTPFRVQTRRSAWVTTTSRRIGGLSSFGAGGTNAHLLVAEAPERVDEPSTTVGPELIVLSARSKDALKQRARDLRQWIETQDSASEAAAPGLAAPPSAQLIAILTESAGRVLGVEAAAIDAEEDWVGLGLSGARLAAWQVDIESRLGRPLASDLIGRSGTIAALARDLVGIKGGGGLAAGGVAALAHTLQVGRTVFSERLAFIAADLGAVEEGLSAFLAGEVSPAEGPADLVAAEERFLAGESVDWRALRKTAPPRRLHGLPTYPFERQSYWVTPIVFDRSMQAPLPVAVAPDAGGAGDAGDFLFLPRWRRIPLHAVVEDRAGTAWIVADASRKGAAERLVESRVTRILSWSEAVEAAADAPDDIVLLPGGGDALADMMRLLQSLGRARKEAVASLRLRLVTLRGHAVLPGEDIETLQAGMSAFLRSALHEWPGTEAACIDLDSDEDIAGVLAMPCGNPVPDFALRGGAGFRRVLHPLTLSSEAAELREGLRVLIAGGGGQVGRELAVELARKAHARVALVGRRAADAAIADTIQAAADAGGEAVYLRGDVTDAGSIRAAVAEAVRLFGGLDLVIHGAVSYGERALSALSEADLAAVWGPKVEGLETLAEAVRDRALDAFVVFSSAQIYAGNTGRAHYAASCAAAAARAHGLAADAPWPLRVIDWGFWDVGELAIETVRAALRQQGATGLSVADGAAALSRIVAGPAVQVAALRLDPAMWPFAGIEEGAGFEATGPAAPSRFDAVRALAPAPDEEGLVARARADFEAVNRHAVTRFLDLLRERGLFRDPGMRHEDHEIAAAFDVVPRHRRFLDAALAHLAAAGLIVPQGEGAWQAVDGASDATAGGHTVDAGAMGAEAALLDRCLDALPAVLTGELEATEVLFPDGSPDSIQSVYRGNPASDWFNAQAASAVAARAQAALDGGEEALRIVEIGAGSGGTTEAVLVALAPFAGRLRLDYAFTDLSPGFVKAAARRFGEGRPWFTTRTLDIEEDPAGQGFATGAADLVLAANVLHATRRMARSLGHAARLLRPRGWLVVNEAVTAEPFTTFTFGLLDGWWLAEDDLRLPHAPLLSADGWRGALADAGFGQTRVLPGPATDPAVDGMRVIVAESAGLALIETAQREDARPATARPAAASPAASAARATDPRIGDDRDRIAALERRVIAEVATAVELPDAGFDAALPFAGLGIDSILAVAVVRHLNDRFGVTLRATDLFNYPDARRLTAHLAEAFPQCLGDAKPESRPGEPMAVPSADAEPPAIAAVARSNGSRAGPAREAFAPIAVIGMSARFPGADDLDAFLRNLESGHDAVGEIPASRWPLDGFYDPDLAAPGRSSGKWGGFLSRIDAFDPAYFRMSPREAELTDPQHRLFLMEAVRALEDAGLTRAALDGTSLGIFVGCKAGDYFNNLGAEDRNAQAFTGNATAILPARLAYHLNTTGPTLTVDTACSSALVALHLACESLRNGESETAVAGAVALMATPHTHLTLSRAGMLSPTGRCRAFDNGADGFVPGEGVGAVVLKRLDRALADGDRIDGVIRASAINQDGRTSSLTAPSAPSQTRLLSELYAKVGIDPASISYIEAHGTGTKLGDPIEAAALTDAFAGKLPPDWRGSIGSVKSMIGHAMEAAGMAALIKTVLMLRAGRLAPSLHFDAPNEHIDFAALPFDVVREARDWPAPTGGGPRRAAISAFGFSGTNAHVVVEEGPAAFAPTSRRQPALAFFVSGHSEAVLRRRCGDLAEWLARGPDVDLAALSATLLLGREHYGHRAAVCGATREEIVEGLRAASEGRPGAEVLLGGGAVKQEPALLELGKLLIERIQAPGLGAA